MVHPKSREAFVANKSQYLEQIRLLAPDLIYQAAVLNDTGQFNAVLTLDHSWIFRFPRYAEGVRQLEAETRLLLALQDRLPLPIPCPRYFCFDPPMPGRACMGYPRLPGEPLLKPESIHGQAARVEAAGQLAGFLRILHAIPPDSLGVELPPADRMEDWANLYSEIREKLFPGMRPEARGQVAGLFESYFGDAALQTFRPTLRHGDFGGSNLLYDRRLKRVSGVLDFSCCTLGDPAADLASVSTCGEALFTLLSTLYEPDEQKRELLLARACFYRGTFALAEALDGLQHHDRRAYESGMEKYR